MDTAVHTDDANAPPSVLLGELFAAVALMDVLPAKDWADATPKAPLRQIIDAYKAQAPATPSEILRFVDRWFSLPCEVVSARRGVNLQSHIEATWDALIRPPSLHHDADSILTLPHTSVAPGGRFRECYYWDAYFTLLGLRDRPEILRAAADNMRWQVEQYGFVPTANRTYYLTRSQPPLFFKIVELVAEAEGAHVVADYLPALCAEHRFWMDGADALISPGAYRRAVRLADGAMLNRYWDDRPAPRDESYRVDVSAAASARGRPAEEIYRDIRAACESGWDFSSRWFADPVDFGSIMTTSIAPIDLNAMLFGLEQFLAARFAALGQAADAKHYATLATARRAAMQRHLWNDALGAYDDYDWVRGKLRGAVSAAVAVPLFFGVADDAQASSTARLVEAQLLAPGGLLMTNVQSDLQWDAPNGWAPLQWFAVEGFARYGAAALSETIRRRWLATVETVFKATGRLVEKYDVVRGLPGGGGEYAVQDGFGWTNGVTKAFLDR
ncbi:MAG: alpha,alpha-trehalase TreF [Terricaulis sp.]